MKRIKLYIIMLAVTTAGFTLTSCDDDFMNEVPQTAITVPGFFNTVTDLETYANVLYKQLPLGGIRDADSDNVTGQGFLEADEVWNVIYGVLSKGNVSASYWGDRWKELRNVNVLLDNADRASGTDIDKNHWKAFGRYVRAELYIRLVQRYGDIPWIEHAIASDDPDVYRGSDPRAFVVDKIMEDLDYATKNLKADMGNKTRVHQYCAWALLSRFALYEGTFRKYHTELNLQSTAAGFLSKSVEASEKIMAGPFDISGANSTNVAFKYPDNSEIKGSPAYGILFASENLDSYAEIIQWNAAGPNVSGGVGSINPTHFSLSRPLMETYLTKEGKPFSSVTGYATKPLYTCFVDRDPRLAETFAHPGSVRNLDAKMKIVIDPTRGGFAQAKFEANRVRQNNYYEGRPVYRFAEILLNYAEAKAELGQFDAKAKEGIDKLRTRVGMPAFKPNDEVDAALKSQYPNVSDNTILALRRERRVELACEGFRLQDVYRWAVGEIFLMPNANKGMFLPAIGPYDYDGDGKADMAIYQNRNEIPSDFTDKGKYPNVINWYYINDVSGVDRGIPATDTEYVDGYLGRKNPSQGRRFRNPTDYYRPISNADANENPNLKQMYDWAN